MSHFSVAVIHRENQSIEDLLARFDENTNEPWYLDFQNCTDEVVEEWNTEVDGFRLPNGKPVLEYDDALYVKICHDEYYELVKENHQRVRFDFDTGDYLKYDPVAVGAEAAIVHYSDVYDSIEDFAEEHLGYKVGQGKYRGEFGYWYNPDSKWDWYEAGGRYSDAMKNKAGECVTTAKVKDINFGVNEADYNWCCRFWDVVVENAPLTDNEGEFDFFSMYSPEHYVRRYGTKEDFAKKGGTFRTYAVVDEDGEWYSEGDMHWFGVSVSTYEAEKDWDENYFKFFENLDPDMLVTIVDCHI